MGKDKLIIRVKKKIPVSKKEYKVIKISGESYNILYSLKDETGLSPNKLLELILDFMMEKIEIQEEAEDYED